MDLDKYLPASPEEYMHAFRATAALINKAMAAAEDTEFVSDTDKSKSLQRIAEGVETIACLRGDSGLFDQGRPNNLIAYQKEMYHIENMLRARLLKFGYTYSSR